MIKYPFYLIAILLIISSCQETSSVGNNLLNDEKFDVQYTDDFELSSQTVEVKPIISYRNDLNLSTFQVGQLDDPIFGHKISEVFFDVNFNNSISIPNFIDATLDSMVLVMTYDTLGSYGNRNALHNLELYPHHEDIGNRDTIYNDEKIDFENRLIGALAFTARPDDSISIINHLDSTELKLPAHIRMRINDDWAEELFSSSTAYEDNDALDAFFEGFYLRNMPNESGLLGLNMGSTSNGNEGLNRLTVYYKDSSNINRIYSFRFGTERGSLVDVDRSGSMSEDIINGVIDNNSLSIISSESPFNLKVNFDDLSFLEDKIINHANLKVYVASIAEDDFSLYDPIQQLLASKYDEESDDLIFIDDIVDVTSINVSISSGFGGNLTIEDGQLVYNMNITKHLKEVMKQDPTERKAEVILSPLSRVQLPNRGVIYGADNISGAMKLEVAYTNY